MSSLFADLVNWLQRHPLFSVLLGFLGVWGYANLFHLGFQISIPPALRPFLDGYHFSTVTFEFFMSATVAAIGSKVVVLFFRYILAQDLIKVSKSFLHMVDVSIEFVQTSDFGDLLDREASVRLKLIARWIRKKSLGITTISAFLIFSLVFLGKHGFWYIVLCVVAAPIIWALLSRVELRRTFATKGNTKTISSRRLYVTLVSFAAIYLGFCVFLAGVASFQHRMDTQVSIGIGASERHGSIVAVTAAGVLVASRETHSNLIRRYFYVSAHFLPFETLSSIGQRNYRIEFKH